jgi:single-strand DNA-binding protein
MPYENQVLIMGHLGRDAETKHTGSGHSITTFSVAVENGTKDKPRTAWLDVKAWNQCQAALDILTKGSLVAVTGRLDVETWEDKETGKRRSKTLVVADMIHQPQWEKREKSDDSVVSRPRSSQAKAAPAAQHQSASLEIDGSDVPF